MADVTDKDRLGYSQHDLNVAVNLLMDHEGASADWMVPLAKAIAQARAEGRAELDAERAAHEATKARLALAEAVCEHFDSYREAGGALSLNRSLVALAAWRAAK